MVGVGNLQSFPSKLMREGFQVRPSRSIYISSILAWWGLMNPSSSSLMRTASPLKTECLGKKMRPWPYPLPWRWKSNQLHKNHNSIGTRWVPSGLLQEVLSNFEACGPSYSQWFALGTIDISRLNFGILSLIPKVLGVESIKQYCPIVLINVLFKFLDKAVASILSPVAHRIIAPLKLHSSKGDSS
jgi:hypothetical protein